MKARTTVFSRPGGGGVRRGAADCENRAAEVKRRLGALMLGTLIGGLPELAVADARAQKRCDPVCQQHQRRTLELDRRASSASSAIQIPLTETSGLALSQALAFGSPAMTFTVTTTADVVDPGDGQLSLREAVDRANATTALDAIQFATSLEGQILELTGGELVVDDDLIINGDRNGDDIKVTLDGSNRSRILRQNGAETDLALQGLVLTHGRTYGHDIPPGGAAILVQGGGLTVERCTISNNSNSSYETGGGIASYGGRLTVVDSIISGNYSYDGGGIGGNRYGVGGIGLIVTIRRSQIVDNIAADDGGGLFLLASSIIIEDSIISGNTARGRDYGSGGGIKGGGTILISRSTISDNVGSGVDPDRPGGGGLEAFNSHTTITDSTIANNRSFGVPALHISSGELTLRNSTITGNDLGIYSQKLAQLDIANSIVAGNKFEAVRDIVGRVAVSNGHNVFGSAVAGAIAGDRENVPASAVFATVDPATGGGLLNSNGVVSLRDNIANPALTGADPLVASATGQLGTSPRPQPTGSLPDIGSIEINQPLSTRPTANNDVLSGNAGANTIAALQGNDLLRGLGGPDTLNADGGSDVLDGGPGNNRLNGGTGVDLATFAFSGTRVVVDLSGSTDTAKRGSETDLLTSIEGAIGTIRADRFIGNASANAFQGGRGRDISTGGGGRDSFDFDAIQDSPPGANSSDRISDFTPGQDVLDLARIDADPSLPGDQPFIWRGTAAFTGALGEVRYVKGATTIVQATTDGDLAPEFEIRLIGNKTLTEDDVRL